MRSSPALAGTMCLQTLLITSPSPVPPYLDEMCDACEKDWNSLDMSLQHAYRSSEEVTSASAQKPHVTDRCAGACR